MASDWLKTLGVADTLTVQTLANQGSKPATYTKRDAETLNAITAHPTVDNSQVISGNDGPVPRFCETSNAEIGKKLLITGGAAAARVARLAKMGIIRPQYETAVQTGKITRRIIEILVVPPEPWTH